MSWPKEPPRSDELRKWFAHDAERFAEFRKRYLRELREAPARELVDGLAERAERTNVTLLFAARDEEHNNAVIVAEEIERRASRAPRRRSAVAEGGRAPKKRPARR